MGVGSYWDYLVQYYKDSIKKCEGSFLTLSIGFAPGGGSPWVDDDVWNFRYEIVILGITKFRQIQMILARHSLQPNDPFRQSD